MTKVAAVLLLPVLAGAYSPLARPAAPRATNVARMRSSIISAFADGLVDPSIVTDATALIAASDTTSFLLASTSSVLPPEFADLSLTPPPQPKFSHYLMNAIGCYTIFTAITTFGPRAISIARGVNPDALSVSLLERAPHSDFSLHLADLRTPLPATVYDLTAHRVGVKDNRQVWLCSEEHLLSSSPTFSRVEYSADFSAYYGGESRVYICYE